MKKKLQAILFLLALFLSIGGQAETIFSEPAKSIFISYEEVPSKVYVGQIFPIKVKAIVAKNNFDDIINIFSESKSVEIINPDAKWQALDNNTFYTTFYIKIKSTPANLPNLSINILLNRDIIESERIALPHLNIVQLKKDPIFSNVIAESLGVKKHKTTTFDSKSLIIVLELEATYSNLKDFTLSSVTKNSVDSFSDNHPIQRAYYYAIIPNYQKTFEFTYFDIRTNKFVKTTLPVIIEDDVVSTQIGLNPKESIFEFYKTIGYGILAFLFFIIFLKKRRFFYLLIALVFLGLFFLDKNPLNNVTLKEHSSVMILPTEKSTVFLTTTKSLSVEKLGTRESYIKILLPDGKIGWTPSENIVKN